MLESCSRVGPGHILLQNRALALAPAIFCFRIPQIRGRAFRVRRPRIFCKSADGRFASDVLTFSAGIVLSPGPRPHFASESRSRLRLPYILCWNRALAQAPATFCFRIALSPKTSLHFIVESCSRLCSGHILLQNRVLACEFLTFYVGIVLSPRPRPHFASESRSRLRLPYILCWNRALA